MVVIGGNDVKNDVDVINVQDDVQGEDDDDTAIVADVQDNDDDDDDGDDDDNGK